MSPMTMVVVRDVPAGSSEDGASAFVAGFEASVVTGGAEVVGADAAGAGAVAAEPAVEAVLAVEAVAVVVDGCCDKAADDTRRARRRAEIAERRFMTGETIEPTGMRQAGTARA